MYYKLAPLILTSSQKSNTYCDIFISQPDAEKEALAGKLFILVEIDSKKSDSLKVLNFIINNLNHNYYQNEKILLRERISTLKVEHIFENALANTNTNLLEFLKREKIKINLKSFSLTAGIIYENILHFSNSGKNKALLIYKKREEENIPEKSKKIIRDSGLKTEYKTVDIVQDCGPDDNIRNENKIFSNVISGPIPTGGYFLFSNETLPEYLSGKQIIEIVTKLPPSGAAEQIKNTLTKLNSYVSFLGLIIKNTAGLKPNYEENYDKKIPRQDSSINLCESESSTEKLLSPSGIISFKRLRSLFEYFTKKSGKKSGQKLLNIKDKILVKKKQSFFSFSKLFSFTKHFFALIFRFILYILAIITNKDRLKKTFINIIDFFKELKNILYNFFSRLKNLNLKNKLLLGSSLIVAVILIISLLYTSDKNKKIETSQELDSLLSELQLKQNQVEANLLYGNESGAKEFLDEIYDLLLKLENFEITDNNQNYKEILEKNNEQLAVVMRMELIENPEELANFSNLNSQASPLNIILINNKIYSGDSSQKTVYKLNIEDKLITAITDINLPISELKFPTNDSSGGIYFYNINNLIKLNDNNGGFSEIEINLPENKVFTASAEYNNRLYFLDNKNNQIYRFSKSPINYTQRDNWLKEEINLENFIDISIDGNIYALKSDGEIKKFDSGEEVSFNLNEVSPKIQQAKKFYVSRNGEYIYTLEPSSSRLIVYNKEGEFLMQYKFSTLDDIKDFKIDEANKNIYILNNSSVYQQKFIH